MNNEPQMPSNTPPGSAWFRRSDGQRRVAVQVTPANRPQIAAWVGGDPWGAGVAVPTPDGGEIRAPVGSWIVTRPDGWWAIWPADTFRAAWRAEVTT